MDFFSALLVRTSSEMGFNRSSRSFLRGAASPSHFSRRRAQTSSMSDMEIFMVWRISGGSSPESTTARLMHLPFSRRMLYSSNLMPSILSVPMESFMKSWTELNMLANISWSSGVRRLVMWCMSLPSR